MPRKARKYYDTSFFHVIVQGINKEYIFENEKYMSRYIKIIKEKSSNNKINLIAYCVMNNHAHFLIQTDQINEMSCFMHNVNTTYAKFYNKDKNRVGYVFRDRYKSEPISNERYFIKCINYIHNNPVKAKIVDSCKNYKFSSYSEFLSDKKINQIKELLNLDIDKEYFIKPLTFEGFMEVEENCKEKIYRNTKIFCNENKYSWIDIFENRNTLKELIRFLKKECGIKYVDIMKVMEISKGVMNNLRESDF